MFAWMSPALPPPLPPKISAEAAQRTAAAFASQHLADILQAGTPYLVTTAHGLCWRVPLLFNHPAVFPLAPAGTLDIGLHTGQPLLTAEQQQGLLRHIYQTFRHALRR